MIIACAYKSVGQVFSCNVECVVTCILVAASLGLERIVLQFVSSLSSFLLWWQL